MHTNLISKIKLTLLASVMLVTPFALNSGIASASGGSNSTGYTNDIGPCATDWIFTDVTGGQEQTYPLPGAGHVRMLVTNTGGLTSITVRGVCTDSGWTATAKNVSTGVEATFSGPNGAGVDFKYVSGKTVVRYR
jgi:hypothetical protein